MSRSSTRGVSRELEERAAPASSGAKPSAIVLCKVVTGLATVRALARKGVDVHAFIFDADDPLQYSRHANKVFFDDRANDEEWLVDFLVDYATKMGGRPVVLPTSDAFALMLARHASRLDPVCRTTRMSLAELETIVHKNELYAAAATAGVPLVASVDSPNAEELARFAATHEGPYLLKPLFEAAPGSQLRRKNLVVSDSAQLIAYGREHGLEGVVVQRLVRGGDGEVYDTYGFCNARGEIVTIATHRRLRQFPRNFGTTTLGEIPSGLGDAVDALLIEQTRRLLRAVHFHGIFGIEWIRDTRSGEYCLIDFNARPFSSIGHLEECGLNLPHLAWRDLAGEDLRDVEPEPKLRHSVWVNVMRDFSGWRRAGEGERESLWAWARSLLDARSFAYWDPRDPGPFLVRVGDLRSGVGAALRRGRSWFRSKR